MTIDYIIWEGVFVSYIGVLSSHNRFFASKKALSCCYCCSFIDELRKSEHNDP